MLSITFLLGVEAFLRSMVAFERGTESSIEVPGVVAIVWVWCKVVLGKPDEIVSGTLVGLKN